MLLFNTVEFCLLEKPGQPVKYIREGYKKRVSNWGGKQFFILKKQLNRIYFHNIIGWAFKKDIPTHSLFFFQLYKYDDPDCSELCECHMGKKLTCKVLKCIAKDACNTGVAFYSHASPFYRAHRGQCLCYSGAFVCSKPPKG